MILILWIQHHLGSSFESHKTVVFLLQRLESRRRAWGCGSPVKLDRFQRESSGLQQTRGGRRMKGKRFTEEQIIGVLKEAEAGLPQPDLLRKHGISQGTFYRWKAKYGGLDVSEARRLKSLEDENRRLKRLVADQALDIQILKDINSKKW